MKIVKIGNQEWMVKNLNVSTFRNGDPITEAKSDEEWEKLGGEGKPAWCYYANDKANDAKYGKLYNWYAVNDPRGLAPAGWHVPSDAEWKELEMCLGMNQLAADDIGYRGTDEGDKMKETGTAHWQSPNNANNESNLSVLPGGYRFNNGYYHGMGGYAAFWSSTEYGSRPTAWSRGLSYDSSVVLRRDDGKPSGFSVLCVRD